MNTPNKLTVIRILLIPFFILFLLMRSLPHNYLLALIVFVVASATDALDGHLARKNDLVTNFGKFLDPLADKLLITSALICFVDLGFASSIVVVLITAREFLVTSLRLVAADKGTVISASPLGKAKTVSQMMAVIAILMMQEGILLGIMPMNSAAVAIGEVLMWIACIFTLVSGIQYLYNGRAFILSDK